MVRFQGELAGYIMEAVQTVDLKAVPLVVIRDAKAKDTTIRVSEEVFNRLSEISKARKASVNALIKYGGSTLARE